MILPEQVLYQHSRKNPGFQPGDELNADASSSPLLRAERMSYAQEVAKRLENYKVIRGPCEIVSSVASIPRQKSEKSKLSLEEMIRIYKVYIF